MVVHLNLYEAGGRSEPNARTIEFPGNTPGEVDGQIETLYADQTKGRGDDE